MINFFQKILNLKSQELDKLVSAIYMNMVQNLREMVF